MLTASEMDYRPYISYDRAELLVRIQMHLDQARYQHCLRVEQTAIDLAEKYHADVKQAGLAGLVHDYAKQRSNSEFKTVILDEGFDTRLLEYNNGIWHGIVGTYFIERELGITNSTILNAVRRHTIGAPEMSVIDQIVFIADYIEPGRDFPGVEEARKAAAKSLTDGVQYELKNVLLYLVENDSKVFPPTIESYNAWLPTKGD